MKLLLAIFVFMNLAIADEYIKKDSKIFIDGTEVGTVYKGTQVKKAGDQYTASGWVMKDNEYILFHSNSERIKLLRIDNKYIKDYTQTETKKDVYEVTWRKAELTFVIKEKDVTSDNFDQVWAAEKELYMRCGTCHSPHPVDEFTVNQWPSMIKAMSSNAGLSKEEVKTLSAHRQYLRLQQLQGAKK